MQTAKPGLLHKVSRTLTERPGHLFQYARGYLLFSLTSFLKVFFLPSGVLLGRNVRLQKLRSLRAEKTGARISIGDHSIVYENALIEAYGRGQIRIGECSVLGDLRIACRDEVSLGARVITSWNVFIQDFDPHPTDSALRAVQVHNLCAGFLPSDGSLQPKPWPAGSAPPFSSAKISIGDDVWIGASATILKGARIGRGCIVAAGAVVISGDYPPESLLAGNPAVAKPLKKAQES